MTAAVIVTLWFIIGGLMLIKAWITKNEADAIPFLVIGLITMFVTSIIAAATQAYG